MEFNISLICGSPGQPRQQRTTYYPTAESPSWWIQRPHVTLHYCPIAYDSGRVRILPRLETLGFSSGSRKRNCRVKTVSDGPRSWGVGGEELPLLLLLLLFVAAGCLFSFSCSVSSRLRRSSRILSCEIGLRL